MEGMAQISHLPARTDWQALRRLTTAEMERPSDRDFPGSPVVKTPHFPCRAWGFDPGLGNLQPTCHRARKRKFLELNKSENATHQLIKERPCGRGPQGWQPYLRGQIVDPATGDPQVQRDLSWSVKEHGEMSELMTHCGCRESDYEAPPPVAATWTATLLPFKE